MTLFKNTILVAASVTISIMFSNFLLSIYLDYYRNSTHWVLNEEEINLYRNYENKINHLRYPAIESEAPYLTEASDLVFSKISQKDVSASVLISGDSWGEKFASDLKSYQKLKEFSHSKRINITLSGTSSYSPTLLGIQSRILKTDFDLSFDEAFIVIDNTDVGDELCRYRNFIEKDSDGNKIVRKFVADDAMAVYTNETMLYVSEILNSKDYALKKFGLLVLKKFVQPKHDKINCGWSRISDYLNELSEDDVRYFESALEYMLKEIRQSSPTINIHILTIPHRKHVTGEYKISVSMLISEFLKDKKFSGVNHRDFADDVNNLIIDGYQLNDIFIEGDPASHLTSFAHNEILVSFIITTLGTD